MWNPQTAAEIVLESAPLIPMNAGPSLHDCFESGLTESQCHELRKQETVSSSCCTELVP